MPAPTLPQEGSSTPGSRPAAPKKHSYPTRAPRAKEEGTCPRDAAVLPNHPPRQTPSPAALQTNKPSPTQGKPSTSWQDAGDVPGTLAGWQRAGAAGASPARGAARGTSQGDAGKAECHSYLWAGREGGQEQVSSAPCPGVPPQIGWQRESPRRSTGCPTCTSAQMPAGSTPPRCPPATWNWHSNNLAAARAASFYPRT